MIFMLKQQLVDFFIVKNKQLVRILNTIEIH